MGMKLGDKEIRTILHQYIRENFDMRKYILDDEFRLSDGFVVADVALIGTDLIGFEIKSDKDVLDRLSVQSMVYSNAFSECFLVTTPKYAERASLLVPDWWGILIVEERDNTLFMSEYRRGEENLDVTPLAVLQLLKKKEAGDLLRLVNSPISNKKKAEIYLELMEKLQPDELIYLSCLKVRARYHGRHAILASKLLP